MGEACAWGLPETVSFLLTQGAGRDHETSTGATPLCTAVEFGHLATVECLIEAGAEVNLESKDGETPLMMAVRVQEHDIMSALLEANADAELPNKNGKTVLSVAHDNAEGNGGQEVLKLIKNGIGKDREGAVEDTFDLLDELGNGAYAVVLRAKRKVSQSVPQPDTP